MIELIDILLRSIMVSGTATILAALWSIPLSYYIVKTGKLGHVKPLLEALVGTPTVLIGLLIYMLLCTKCPLGFLNLLYTPTAIIIGQSILVTPLIMAVSIETLNTSYTTYGELAYTLGADKHQVMNIVLRESAPGIIGGVIMGFSRAIGELGVALIVGGNIKGYTRVMTTAIALEVSKGEFENAIALGLLLLIIVVSIALTVRYIRGVYQR